MASKEHETALKLVSFILRALTLQAEKKMRLPVSCAVVQWPSKEVMRALGLETQPGGGGATWIYARAYRTRNWNPAWRQIRQPVETNAGVLGFVAGPGPRSA